MARKTGSHLCIFQGLLILMPMRKTTNSPSISADIREPITFAKGSPLVRTFNLEPAIIEVLDPTEIMAQTCCTRELYAACGAMRWLPLVMLVCASKPILNKSCLHDCDLDDSDHETSPIMSTASFVS